MSRKLPLMGQGFRNHHARLRGRSAAGLPRNPRSTFAIGLSNAAVRRNMARHASDLAIAPLPASLRFAWVRGDSAPANASGRRENRLLRQNEGGFRHPGMRTTCAEVRSGSTMLRGLRLRSCGRSGEGCSICLPGRRRRKFCGLHFFRAQPLASASGSAAARLIRFRIASARSLRRARAEGNSNGGFHEISLIDRSGPGARRHSQRDFAFG
ncbi:MAG: hypothetical protein QOJ87_246 [Verrucomicrobiota bacterium]